jgi:3-hydroxy-5-methyl-1-naphthoate 3-O-methyltransferase
VIGLAPTGLSPPAEGRYAHSDGFAMSTSVTERKHEISTAGDLLELAHSFEPSRAFLTALELGVFTALGGRRRSADEVAKAIGTEPSATARILDAMVALGLLRKEGVRYHNAPLAAKHLIQGRNGYLEGLIHSANGWGAWSMLTYALKRGRAVGSSFVDDDEQRAATEAYMAAMAAQAHRFAPWVARHLDLRRVGTMLDVGGGPGIFSIAFATANPKLRATVLDRSEIEPICRRNVRRAKLERRIKFIVGDYLADSLGSGYDLLYFSQVVHGNSREQNQMIMDKASAALAPGGRVAVLDYLMDEARTSPVSGTLFSLSMLVTSDAGDTYRHAEVAEWMGRAGLEASRAIPISAGQSLLIASKPLDQRTRRLRRGRRAR